MGIQRDTVEHIAELAKLQLTEDEIEMFAEQLAEILSYAERLNELDTGAIPPTASVLPLDNVMRPDEVQPSLARDAALRTGPATAEGQFVVDAVLDGGEA